MIIAQSQSIPTTGPCKNDKECQEPSASDIGDGSDSQPFVAAGQALIITEESFQGGVLYRLEGDLDLETVPMARSMLAPVLNGADARPVLLDLQAVTYLDSTGLALLAALYRKTQPEDGSLSVALIVTPDTQTRRILQLCGFEKVFTILNSRDAVPQVGTHPL